VVGTVSEDIGLDDESALELDREIHEYSEVQVFLAGRGQASLAVLNELTDTQAELKLVSGGVGTFALPVHEVRITPKEFVITLGRLVHAGEGDWRTQQYFVSFGKDLRGVGQLTLGADIPAEPPEGFVYTREGES
jgi:hypothetical protein